MFSLTLSAFENQGLKQTGQPEHTAPIPGQARPNGPSRVVEHAARAAVEQRAGRCLSDAEWAEARSRLLDFGAILRGWDRGSKNPEPELGNVDAICQQER